jgi:hypothetical protein
MESKHKGARSELIACAWLLEQGYEVFLATGSPSIGTPTLAVS